MSQVIFNDAAPFDVQLRILNNGDVVSQTIFGPAGRIYNVLSASEKHAAAGTDGGAVTGDVTIDADGSAAGSGTSIFSSGTFDLKATANTKQTKAATAALQIAAGRCIGFKLT